MSKITEYIRVVLGKIEAHSTLGLLPPLVQNYTMTDRDWQMAMYNQKTDKVCFITKSSWNNKVVRGTVIISELIFDVSKGVLSATEISRGVFAKGSEPSYVYCNVCICRKMIFFNKPLTNRD